jgi:hypothetical protein
MQTPARSVQLSPNEKPTQVDEAEQSCAHSSTVVLLLTGVYKFREQPRLILDRVLKLSAAEQGIDTESNI